MSASPDGQEIGMRTHEFTGCLDWVRGAEGIAARTHRITFDGRPTLELSAARRYHGDPSRLNPEELLVASLASCQLLSYLHEASRAGITVLAYADRPVGTLAIVDRTMRVAEIVLRPRITVAAAGDVERARALVAPAHAGCFIARSITARVHLEPEVLAG